MVNCFWHAANACFNIPPDCCKINLVFLTPHLNIVIHECVFWVECVTVLTSNYGRGGFIIYFVTIDAKVTHALFNDVIQQFYWFYQLLIIRS